MHVMLIHQCISMIIFSLQVRVLASDGGTPSLTDVTVVYLNITRNLFAPSFNPTQYSQIIPESQALGAEILRVQAFDQDTAVSISSLSFSLYVQIVYIGYVQDIIFKLICLNYF